MLGGVSSPGWLDSGHPRAGRGKVGAAVSGERLRETGGLCSELCGQALALDFASSGPTLTLSPIVALNQLHLVALP